jgi:hypothetical protein
MIERNMKNVVHNCGCETSRKAVVNMNGWKWLRTVSNRTRTNTRIGTNPKTCDTGRVESVVSIALEVPLPY